MENLKSNSKTKHNTTMEDIKDSSSNIVTADGAINLIITNNIKLKDINISKTIVGESQSLLNQVL
jgi:hypothetical protein